MFYAVAHHGTAGLGNSYGYVEVIEGKPPRSGLTVTVAGPYASKADADAEAEAMEAECLTFRKSQDT